MKQNDKTTKTSPADTLTQLILTAGVATRYDVDDETVRVWHKADIRSMLVTKGWIWSGLSDLVLAARV